jgi:hypothetical protein
MNALVNFHLVRYDINMAEIQKSISKNSINYAISYIVLTMTHS